MIIREKLPAQPGPAIWHRVQAAWIAWADLNSHRLWFSVFLFGLIWADTLVLFLPGDTLVVLAVISAPRFWWRSASAAALGGWMGGLTIYLLVAIFGSVAFIQALSWAGVSMESQAAQAWFKDYGVFSIIPGCLMPVGHQVPIILAGLSKANPFITAACVLLGKSARYFLICFGVREGWTLFNFIRKKASEEKEHILRK